VEPSSWITRFGAGVPAGGPVLDVACGGGRHTRWFAARGHPVTAVDRDLSDGVGLACDPRLELIELIEHDLEDGSPWPFAGRSFAAVVVTNYLYRPILADLVGSVAVGGWLLYETFAAGNERFGRPSNPDFLLRPGELLDAVRGALRVVAYEDVIVDAPRPAAVQRIAATRDHGRGDDIS
jgi:SAM-dependent methyltransferase